MPLDGFDHELLLRGDRALVISQRYGTRRGLRGKRVASRVYGYDQPRTILTEVDIGQRGRMRVLSTETVDGSFIGGRLSGDTARVVVSSQPLAFHDSRLSKWLVGWIPTAEFRNEVNGRSSIRPVARCRQVRRATGFYSGGGMLTILTIDLDEGLPASDVDALMTNGQTIYASRDSLYLATPRWFRLTRNRRTPPQTTTAIHAFDSSRSGATRYFASGQVRGHLLNQFSLSEHRGYLRVASTSAPAWWARNATRSQSRVTVLHRDGRRLAEVGRVGGLGRGEQIYAVRFIGDKGFVVTFRQVDPLYTIDLASPLRPRAVGELKIPGYSAYLHPLRDNLLIGIGQNADEEGFRTGAQISLFDVSDLSRPVRLHKLTVADARTTVEWDHHAFLWWRPRKLAVLPLSDGPFQGAIGYRVGQASGINEAGRTAHVVDSHRNPIQRAFVVRGRLFTLSDAGLQANDMATLAQQAWLPLGDP